MSSSELAGEENDIKKREFKEIKSKHHFFSREEEIARKEGNICYLKEEKQQNSKAK